MSKNISIKIQDNSTESHYLIIDLETYNSYYKKYFDEDQLIGVIYMVCDYLCGSTEVNGDDDTIDDHDIAQDNSEYSSTAMIIKEIIDSNSIDRTKALRAIYHLMLSIREFIDGLTQMGIYIDWDTITKRSV